MNITLTLDDKVIQKAKLYAMARGRSLSELIESYVDSLSKEFDTAKELTPSVKYLQGAFKPDQYSDYKKILQNEKQRKFG